MTSEMLSVIGMLLAGVAIVLAVHALVSAVKQQRRLVLMLRLREEFLLSRNDHADQSTNP